MDRKMCITPTTSQVLLFETLSKLYSERNTVRIDSKMSLSSQNKHFKESDRHPHYTKLFSLRGNGLAPQQFCYCIM